VPTDIPIERAVRIGVVGLGQIAELCLATYRDNPDANVVALCDRDHDRLDARAKDWPDAARFTDLEAFLATDIDLVEVLVPTPLHVDVVVAALEAGHHVQVQKPIACSLDEADRMLAARDRAGALLRIMEDYLFYEPLTVLRDVVASGEIGEPAGVHMKMVATGSGGWEVAPSSWMWQLEQTRRGLGILTFDDGWHKFAVARWLFGPVARVMGWVGRTPVGGGFEVDAPATVMWEHTSGLRGVLDLTFAPDTYWRSEYYSCDERVEVTGTRGFARVNRVTAHGLQVPAVEVYTDGRLRSYHALADDLASSFAKSTAHVLSWLRTGHGELLLDGEAAREVLSFVLAALQSSVDDRPIMLTPPARY
jgi:predicted dehydrogenase